MTRFIPKLAVAGLLLLPALASAASEALVYKKVEGKELKLLVDKPPGSNDEGPVRQGE